MNARGSGVWLMVGWVREVNRLGEGSAEGSVPHLPAPCLWSLLLRKPRVPGRLGGVAVVRVQARARYRCWLPGDGYLVPQAAVEVEVVALGLAGGGVADVGVQR